MKASADEASGLLRALSSPHRLMLVCLLIEGDQNVGALAEALDQREALVSQHLAILRRERIVAARRDGQTIWYSIASPEARAVIEALAAHFCNPEPASGLRRRPRA